MIEAVIRPRFGDWRTRARELLDRGVEPALIAWNSGESGHQDGLFGASEAAPVFDESGAPSSGTRKFSVPADFVSRAKFVAAHRDPARWSLLYSLLWRMTHGEPELMQISVDAEVARFDAMFRQVRRDMHKMTAFVRFRELADAIEGEPPTYVAWHEPDHLIVELTAPFFARRFNGMRWSILTPDASAHWDGDKLQIAPGCPRSMAPRSDEAEALWKTYYAAIFNPARIKTGAMKKEMPVRYWKNLPETQLINDLIREAPKRLQEFHANAPKSAEHWMPGRRLPAVGAESLGAVVETLSNGEAPLNREAPSKPELLAELKQAALACRACGICETATQTVFGEGPVTARIVFVGEQPGDQEDRAGRPFVGPAGQLLDRALQEAGLVRSELYLTNAVKHFKWKPQGKVRLHQRPSGTEISACKPWLTAELNLLEPEILVCLGATAAQSVLGKSVTIGEVRGQWIESRACASTLVTAHPSSILRTQDPAAQEVEYRKLVDDLKKVALSRRG